MSTPLDVIKSTKKLLRSLLESVPRSISVRQLDDDYLKFVGSRIPYRQMGYSTLTEFLSSIPDVVSCSRIRGEVMVTFVIDEATQHVASLVSRNKSNKRTRGQSRGMGPRFAGFAGRELSRHNILSVKTTTSTKPPMQSDVAHQQSSYNIFRGQVKQMMFNHPEGLHLEVFDDEFMRSFGNYPPLTDMGYYGLFELLQSMPDVVSLHSNKRNEVVVCGAGKWRSSKVPSSGVSCSDSTKPNPGNGWREDHSSDISSNESVSGVSCEQKQKIQQVLQLHPNGIKSSKFLAEYKRVLKSELDLKYLNYLTVVDLMANLSDIVVTERPTSGDWILFDKGSYHSSAIKDSELNVDAMCKIPEVVKHFPDGLLLQNLPVEYEAYTGFKLNYIQLGYSSVEDVVCQLKEKIVMTYIGEGQIVLTYRKDLPEANVMPKAQRLYSFQLCSGIPDDAVPIGLKFQPAIYPQVSKDYIQVRVSNVISPAHFWIQLNEFNNQLEAIMASIQVYNDRSMDAYKIPHDLLKPGLVCAGIYADGVCDEWHRCMVTGLRDEFVQLYYVDYGTTAYASRSAVRWLRSQFFQLPAQAIPARLTNTYPVAKDWCRDSFNHFMSMVCNRTLLGQVTNIGGPPDRIVSLCLCDTSGDDDIHVQDVLVEAKLAVCRSDADMNVSQVSTKPEPTALACQDPSSMQHTNDDVSEPLHSELNYDINELVTTVAFTTEYSIHAIKINNTLYVNSTEVAALLSCKDDVLKSKLRQMNVSNISKLTLTREDDKELVVALARACVPGIVNNGLIRAVVTLYGLESVYTILVAFSHPSEELLLTLRQLIAKRQAHLQNQDGSQRPSPQVDMDILANRKRELEDYLKYLHSRRKTVLANLHRPMSQDSSRQAVDELTQIEEQQNNINKELEGIEKCLTLQSADPLSGLDVTNQPIVNGYNFPRNRSSSPTQTQPNAISRDVRFHQTVPGASSANGGNGVSSSRSIDGNLSAALSQLSLTAPTRAAAAGPTSNFAGLSHTNGLTGLGTVTPASALNHSQSLDQFLKYIASADINTLVAASSVAGMGSLPVNDRLAASGVKPSSLNMGSERIGLEAHSLYNTNSSLLGADVLKTLAASSTHGNYAAPGSGSRRN